MELRVRTTDTACVGAILIVTATIRRYHPAGDTQADRHVSLNPEEAV